MKHVRVVKGLPDNDIDWQEMAELLDEICDSDKYTSIEDGEVKIETNNIEDLTLLTVSKIIFIPAMHHGDYCCYPPLLMVIFDRPQCICIIPVEEITDEKNLWSIVHARISPKTLQGSVFNFGACYAMIEEKMDD